jgi:hypothetical protein
MKTKLILLIAFLIYSLNLIAGIGMNLKEVIEAYGTNYEMKIQKNRTIITYQKERIRLTYNHDLDLVTKQYNVNTSGILTDFKSFLSHNYAEIEAGYYFYQIHEKGFDIHAKVHNDKIEFIAPEIHKFTFWEKIINLFTI